jgi:hypothetical protein
VRQPLAFAVAGLAPAGARKQSCRGRPKDPRIWANAETCEICGGTAGSIALDESGELRRESFTGVITARLPDTATGQLRAALITGDAAAVYDLDPDLAPWWCPEWSYAYCGDHWVHWDVFDEDDPNWHDSIRGRCPEGNERILED